MDHLVGGALLEIECGGSRDAWQIVLRGQEIMQKERKGKTRFWKALAWRKLVVRLVELAEQSEEEVARV